MKKSISVLLVFVVICISLFSCQTTDENINSGIKVYDELLVYSQGYVSAGIEQYNGTYQPRHINRSWKDENIENKSMIINGTEYVFRCWDSTQTQGDDYIVDLYSDINPDEVYYIYLKRGTDEVVLLTSYSNKPPILTSEKKLVTEEDFITFAKSVADDYMDLEGCSLSIEYVTEENSTPTLYARGNKYIFSKILFGIDTNERVIVYITDNGEVRRIEHTAIDQFTQYKDIEIDVDELNAKAEEIAKGRPYTKRFHNDLGLLYLSVCVEVEMREPENTYLDEGETAEEPGTYIDTVEYIIPAAEVVDSSNLQDN